MLVTPRLTADFLILLILLATGGLDPACSMRMVLDYLIPPVPTIDINIYTVPGNRYVSIHCYCCKLQSTTWYTVHTAVCSLDLAICCSLRRVRLLSWIVILSGSHHLCVSLRPWVGMTREIIVCG
ncbi:unnamed protein product, partial [Ascophyllum nodosum]